MREKKQAQVKNEQENMVFSVSSKNNIEEAANQKTIFIEESVQKDNVASQEEELKKESTESKGWYSSQKPDAPIISPFMISKKNEITNKKNNQELETIAKYSRLGYKIALEGNNEKQLEVVRKYLISIGTEEEFIQIKPSESTVQNEIKVTIEK